MNINNTMANKFQRFLGNIATGFLAPKGNMADYQHAARLYTDDTFRLAPKNKFLYYVVFNINPDAMDDISFEDRHMLELNYLVKQADLPKYTIKTETLNQYNRKTNVYTGITYDPVTLTLHDDNNGITNTLWALYYGYYFADRNNAVDPEADINPIAYRRNSYSPKDRIPFRYGLDNNSDEPFFNSIQLFTLSRQRFFSYLLCNPKITKWDHDGVDQSSGNGILENKMTLAYDAVIYNSGAVQEDDPAGFAVLHYDKTPSPIVGNELLQNGMAGIFGDLFSLNTLGGAGGLVGGLVGGLLRGLSGSVSQNANMGNRRPYGYGQPTFLNRGAGLGSSSGFQQYGFGGGVVPLAALTVAGVGLAVNTVGNVISGVGDFFSSRPEEPSRSVEAPNGEAPAAEDVYGPPMPPTAGAGRGNGNAEMEQRKLDAQVAAGNGRGDGNAEMQARAAAANEADNPDAPEPGYSGASGEILNEAVNGKGKPAPENDMEADYTRYPDTGYPSTSPPSAGETPQPEPNSDIQLEPIGAGYAFGA